jgi:23S rRNA (adenine2030-N6)-methyltransferase
MNYRHAFHAGNFADVHKHVVLSALLERLGRKPKPLLYLDTHAGRGAYDLRSQASERADEWRAGIGRLRDWQPRSEDVKRFLSTWTAADQAHRYPGSPLVALHLLRDGDRAVFVEKQLEEAYALQQLMRGKRGVSVVHGEGYAALKTYLPPREARGLVLMDPPYESEREFGDATRALMFALQRWATGVVAIWYPIKATGEVTRFHNAVKATGLRKLLLIELIVRPMDSPLGLNGSGLLIANPPWQFDTEMKAVCDELREALAEGAAGQTRVEWLVGE